MNGTEELVNRANYTLTELPYDHPLASRAKALATVKNYRGIPAHEGAMEWDYEEYILHLADEIDVLEAALDRTLGLLDYIRDAYGITEENVPDGYRKDGKDVC